MIESQLAEKEAVLASGSVQGQEFYDEYQALKNRLDEQMEAWETATIAVDEFEG